MRRPSHILCAALILVLGVALWPGCGSNTNSEVFEYCIPLEEGRDGIPVARVILDYDRFSAESRPDVVDTSSFLVASEAPISMVDSALLGDTTDATGVVTPERIQLGVADAVADRVVARAAFWDARAFAVTMPPLGPRGQEQLYDGILGGNLLRQYTVRLMFDRDASCDMPWMDATPIWPSVTFSRELPDRIDELSLDGFGVIRYDLAGGGSMALDDAQFDFGATRVTVGACVQPQAFDPTLLVNNNIETDIPVTGVDAFVLIATGTQPLVMSQSFYERLMAVKAVERDAQWVPNPTASSMFLPEGETFATRVNLTRLALVGNRSNKRAPCAEVQRRRWIEWAERCRNDPDCEATLDDEDRRRTFKRKGSAVLDLDVERGGVTPQPTLTAYVVSDDTILFWGLRAEIGTEVPRVDLLVGSDFLRYFEVFLDYPESRLVMRCANYRNPTGDRGGCDPNNPADKTKVCCVESAELRNNHRTCCDTRSYYTQQGDLRRARSCYCGGSPCCQYFRYNPE